MCAREMKRKSRPTIFDLILEVMQALLNLRGITIRPPRPLGQEVVHCEGQWKLRNIVAGIRPGATAQTPKTGGRTSDLSWRHERSQSVGSAEILSGQMRLRG